MSYPACTTLKQLLSDRGLTGNELARILLEREGRRFANGVPCDGFYVQGLVTGQQYAPDTFRDQVAKVFEMTTKQVFPEYLIECCTLKQKRQDRGMTQAQLAEIAGDWAHKAIRSQDISAYECGWRYCQEDTRRAIANALGLPVDVVFPEYSAFAVA